MSCWTEEPTCNLRSAEMVDRVSDPALHDAVGVAGISVDRISSPLVSPALSARESPGSPGSPASFFFGLAAGEDPRPSPSCQVYSSNCILKHTQVTNIYKYTTLSVKQLTSSDEYEKSDSNSSLSPPPPPPLHKSTTSSLS